METANMKITISIKDIINDMTVDELKSKIYYARREIQTLMEVSDKNNIPVYLMRDAYTEIASWRIMLEYRLSQIEN